jgi:hypothetical protein
MNSLNVSKKGLKPKLRDLALSMGENKTLNLKDKTLLRLFSLPDTMLSISSFVFYTAQA